MTYNFAFISSKLINDLALPNSNIENSNTSINSVQFISFQVVPPHIYIIQTLIILKANTDNEKNNKPSILKQAMWHPN